MSKFQAFTGRTVYAEHDSESRRTVVNAKQAGEITGDFMKRTADEERRKQEEQYARDAADNALGVREADSRLPEILSVIRHEAEKGRRTAFIVIRLFAQANLTPREWGFAGRAGELLHDLHYGAVIYNSMVTPTDLTPLPPGVPSDAVYNTYLRISW